LQKRLVIFDCDGTLVNSKFAIASAMSSAFAACALPQPEKEHVWRIIGLSLEEGIGHLLAPDRTDRTADVAAAYRSAFFEQRQSRAPEPVFDGMRECLSALAGGGAVLGIATGKSRRGLDAVLSAHGLAHYFTTLQTADRHPGKPDPAMLHEAMTDTGIAPGDTVFVGDTSFDMAMAVNARITGVGVAWGYHDVSELVSAGAASIVEQPTDLAAALGFGG
jgi:phosphoglycolate phosphatase